MNLLIVNGEWNRVNNENIVTYYGRRSDGKKGKVAFTGVKPYFYVPYIGEGESYLSLDGEYCSKVYADLPTDVKTLRGKYERTYEADIPYVVRNFVDKGFRKYIDIDKLTPVEDTFPPRKCYLDIEVDDSEGFPDVEQAEREILSITFYDTVLKRYIILTTKRPNVERFMEYAQTLSVQIRDFSDEKSMLESFLVYLLPEVSSPDIILGWNVDFDVNYLQNRMLNFGLQFDRKEFCIFDLLEGYKEWNENSSESYELGFITNKELGRTKIPYKGTVKRLFTEDLERGLFYNYTDVSLIKELDEKIDIFNFFFELSKVVGTFDISRFNAGYIVDMYMLRKLKGKYVLPTKSANEKMKVAGADVLTPHTGLYSNVVVFDFHSEYPSLISTFNISPDTLSHESGDIKIDDVMFRRDIEGVVPGMIKELIEVRRKIKSVLKTPNLSSIYAKSLTNQQRLIKEFTNSFYGVFGSMMHRLYNPYCQKSITYLARQHLEFVKEKVEEMGYKVLYGDTDSIFVQINPTHQWGISLERDTKELESYFELLRKLNATFPEFVQRYGYRENNLELGIDAVYSKWCQIGVKKYYFGEIVWDDGWKKELKIRNYATRRSSGAPYSHTKQLELINLVLSGGDIASWWLKENKKWDEHKIDITSIGIVTGSKEVSTYKNKNPMYKAIMNSRSDGINIGGGSKIKIYYLKDKEIAIGVHDELPFKYIKKINWEKHKQRCLVLPMIGIVSTFLGDVVTEATPTKSIDEWIK